MKIDLHVHSSYSKRPSNWFLQKIGCAESYTDPLELYRIARERGMDAVTITDHNIIEGSLQIAHLPDTFVSCEVTSYFPEDRCKVHVLVYRISEAQFAEIDRLRTNVYDMVAYLIAEGIPHALAHPFYSVNGHLQESHFHKSILMFKLFELNGDVDKEANDILQNILTQLSPADIDRLSNEYEMPANHEEPWRKGFLGGSDDHSSLTIARTYTEIAGTDTVDDFLAGLNEGKGTVGYRYSSTPAKMAYGIYGVAYQFYTHKLNIRRYYENDLLMRFLDRMLQTRKRREPGLINRIVSHWRRKRVISTSNPETVEQLDLVKLFQYEAHKLVAEDRDLAAVLEQPPTSDSEVERYWFRFVNESSNKILAHMARYVLQHLGGFNPFDIFHTAGSAGALYTLLAPYFVAYSIYSRNRRFSEQAYENFNVIKGLANPAKPKIAFFTDTIDETNGVALALRHKLRLAQAQGYDLTIISCRMPDKDFKETKGITYFEPVAVHSMPDYSQRKYYIPPLLSMMEYCYARNFTHIQAATPGPIGLSALAVAWIMRLPFYTTYHTSVPDYARYLSDNAAIERMAWRYILWFYSQSHKVFVPSHTTRDELMQRGIAEDKLIIIPRGVDTCQFSPHQSDCPVELPEGLKILYVGRISQEKNMPFLVEAFQRLVREKTNVHLIVAGYGPYLKNMKKDLSGLPCKFLGTLHEKDMAAVYTACDVFVFPSNTDTYGSVVLEAQASGLPVVVTDRGGPQENMIPDKTGLIVRGDDAVDFYLAIKRLLDDAGLREQMGKQARAYAESRNEKEAFERYWRLYDKGGSMAAVENCDLAKAADFLGFNAETTLEGLKS